MNKKTVVIGASSNQDRYSNRAVRMLTKHHHEAIALGFENAMIENIPIQLDWKPMDDIDTVTLYLNPQRQKEFYTYILNLKPKRIIFNPGTENAELEQLATQQNIQTIEACTLVMLSTNQY